MTHAVMGSRVFFEWPIQKASVCRLCNPDVSQADQNTATSEAEPPTGGTRLADSQSYW